MSATGPLILLVEDDPAIRRLLQAVLPAQGYRLIEAETGGEALRLAKQQVPDLILLDLGLPDMDGRDVLTQLRTWSRLPVVILSARDQEEQKVAALDAGADDYLTKPIAIAELQARIRVALRHATRLAPTVDGLLQLGALRLDASRHLILIDDTEIHLSPIEFKLLMALAEADGRVITHGQLLKAVWGPHSERHREYLRVYMVHLRRKLQSTRFHIATEPGIGYRLMGPDALTS